MFITHVASVATIEMKHWIDPVGEGEGGERDTVRYCGLGTAKVYFAD